MDIDWFGRKAQSENRILEQRLNSISTLLKSRRLLEAGAEHIRQLADRCNHRLPVEVLLPTVESDIQLLMSEDRKTSAFQLNPECRPLVLLVEFGYESILLATARLNFLDGRDICEIKSHQLLKGGASVLERKISVWLCGIFASQHPNIPLFKKPEEAFPHFESLSRKIMKLTCNGALDITLRERVIVNAAPIYCHIPFSCKTVSEQFMTLLGEFGALLGLIRRFLKNVGVEFEHIDRVICAGILGTLPLLGDTLRTATSRPVISASSWYRSTWPDNSGDKPTGSHRLIEIKINPHPVLEDRRTKKLKQDEMRMEQLLLSERGKAFQQFPELRQYAEMQL